MYKPNDNNGFTCLGCENFTGCIPCGKVRIPHVAKSMTQMQDLVIYPAGNCGKVNPRSDRNSSRLGTMATGTSYLQVARQWGAGGCPDAGSRDPGWHVNRDPG